MELLLQRTRGFVHDHDSVPAFHAAYLAVSFIVAALLNAGAFALLVGAHMALDVVKYRDVHRMRWRKVVIATVRESLLDLTLLSVALMLSVYVHHTAGIAALGGLIRAEETLVRAAATIIPRMQVLCHLFSVFGNVRTHVLQIQHDITAPFRRSEHLMMCFAVASLLLVIAAPVVLPDSTVVWRTLVHEMVPWRL